MCFLKDKEEQYQEISARSLDGLYGLRSGLQEETNASGQSGSIQALPYSRSLMELVTPGPGPKMESDLTAGSTGIVQKKPFPDIIEDVWINTHLESLGMQGERLNEVKTKYRKLEDEVKKNKVIKDLYEELGQVYEKNHIELTNASEDKKVEAKPRPDQPSKIGRHYKNAHPPEFLIRRDVFL